MMKKILIIEGNKDIRLLYRKAIAFQGFHVVDESQAEILKDGLESLKPDLLMIDIISLNIKVSDLLKIMERMNYKKDQVILVTDDKDLHLRKISTENPNYIFIDRDQTSIGEIVRIVRRILG